MQIKTLKMKEFVNIVWLLTESQQSVTLSFEEEITVEVYVCEGIC